MGFRPSANLKQRENNVDLLYSIHPHENAERTLRAVVDEDAGTVAFDIADGESKFCRGNAQLRRDVRCAEPHQPQWDVCADQFASFTLPVDDVDRVDPRRAGFDRPIAGCQPSVDR